MRFATLLWDKSWGTKPSAPPKAVQPGAAMGEICPYPSENGKHLRNTGCPTKHDS